MSEQARPWWASDGPVDGGIDPDEDPVERVREARRTADARAQVDPWIDAAVGGVGRLAQGLAEAAASHAGSPTEAAGPRRGSGDDAPRDDGAAGEDAPRDDGAAGQDAGQGRRTEAGGPGPGADAGTCRTCGAGTAGDEDGESRPHGEVCGVCPICVGLRALAESRPELMDHLAEAARHVAMAARSLVERPEDEAGDDPLQHIDLD